VTVARDHRPDPPVVCSPLPPRQGTWSVYVHFPWCLKRCGYCDFATSVAREIPREAYADAVIAELGLRTAGLAPRPIATVYFGGGTPSLWGAEHVGRVIAWLDRWGGICADAEVTLEANPGASEIGDLGACADAGVNRISLGIQALDDRRLAWLDRVHDARAAAHALDRVGALVGSGAVARASADLIFGLPGMDAAELVSDVAAVAARGFTHLSAYSLTVEPGTPLARRVANGAVPPPDDTVQVAQLEALPALCAAHGWVRYEVSNYAAPGAESRHNLAYWSGGHWIAVGSAAHGFIPADGALGLRYGNLRHSAAWLAAIARGRLGEAFRERIDAPTHAIERIMTGLRLARGIDLDALAADVGAPMARALIERARARKLVGRAVELDGGRLRLAAGAWPHLDGIAADLAAIGPGRGADSAGLG